MNAGPKTACGGKRPSTGVVALAVFRPIPFWSAGILPAFVVAGETPALPDSRTALRPIPLWSAGILPAFVVAGGTPALPGLVGGTPALRVLPQREGP